MKVFKGTDKDIKCRGYQFTPGVEAVEERADLCEAGFHACEAPLDVLAYYAPGECSRYFEAELEDVSEQRSDDSKVVGKRITLGAEIGIPGLIKAHVEWVKSKIEKNLTGGYASALTGGDASALTGGDASALTGGDASALTGGYASALTGGYASALTGGDASALTGGVRSALAGGVRSALTGGDASALTGGDASALTGGDASCLRGESNSKYRGGLWSVFACTLRDEDCNITGIKTAIVDGETIKADTWYTLKGGEFVEVNDADT